MSTARAKPPGMSTATAGRIEAAIILLCAASLLFIFQPFSKLLSGFGMGLVVLGGLAFNLVPLCEPGRPARDLWRAAATIAVIFALILALALGSAWLYGAWLQAQRG